MAILIAAIFLLSVGIASFVYYDTVLRRITVTFEETGLPSGTNWSITVWGPTPYQKYTEYSNTSKIVFNGMVQNHKYPFHVAASLPYWSYYGGWAYFANLSSGSYWFGLNTHSNSTKATITFRPFQYISSEYTQIVLNNTTYEVFPPIIANGTQPDGPHPTPAYFDFTTALKNSGTLDVTSLSGSNNTVIRLYGSYTVQSVNVSVVLGQTAFYLAPNPNGLGFNLINTSNQLPWTIGPSFSNQHPLVVNMSTPNYPVCVSLTFTFTLVNWNPDAT